MIVDNELRKAELWDRQAAQHRAELAAFLATDPVALATPTHADVRTSLF